MATNWFSNWGQNVWDGSHFPGGLPIHTGGDLPNQTNKQRKHGHDQYLGPYTVTQVNDNGTVKLVKVAKNNNGGAVHETWNIRMIYPCMA